MRIRVTILFVVALAGCSSVLTAPSIPVSSGLAPRAMRDSGRYQTLHSFDTQGSGGVPETGLLLRNGLLYGTTSEYGKGYGAVFSMDAFGRVRLVHAFTGFPDGRSPRGGVVWFNGALYGTTIGGGLHLDGTIFAVTTGGAERIVHSFGKRGDGQLPIGGLIDVNGTLYGTTQDGGARGKGTVFEVGASGERVLHSFAGAPNDGGHPTAGLVRYENALYGTTRAGGRTASGGTVFKITPFGEESVLHSFGVSTGDGSNPAAALIVVNGAFYGTTLRGGNRIGAGTVFAMTPSGSERVLHAFAAGTDGQFPLGALIAVKGELFGTTMSGGVIERRPGYCLTGPGAGLGGSPTCGTIFKIDAFGDEHVLYRFHGYPDGANPEAGLTDFGGSLFGTTAWGGSHRYDGTVFGALP